MATGSRTRLGKDSKPKYRGVKAYGGQKVKTSQIIVRQKGTKMRPGKNVRMGRDHTIFASREGVVEFKTKKIKRFDGSRIMTKIVNVTI